MLVGPLQWRHDLTLSHSPSLALSVQTTNALLFFCACGLLLGPQFVEAEAELQLMLQRGTASTSDQAFLQQLAKAQRLVKAASRSPNPYASLGLSAKSR